MEFTKKGILSAFWSLLSNPIVTDLVCLCLGAAWWPRWRTAAAPGFKRPLKLCLERVQHRRGREEGDSTPRWGSGCYQCLYTSIIMF
ncbi:hypothetical protein B484DRAFT_454715, partial [Ochromonadaceae sp. CCMP2298]